MRKTIRHCAISNTYGSTIHNRFKSTRYQQWRGLSSWENKYRDVGVGRGVTIPRRCCGRLRGNELLGKGLDLLHSARGPPSLQLGAFLLCSAILLRISVRLLLHGSRYYGHGTNFASAMHQRLQACTGDGAKARQIVMIHTPFGFFICPRVRDGVFRSALPPPASVILL